MLIWIAILEMINLCLLCECEIVDEQMVEKSIEIDCTEAEKYNFFSGVMHFLLLVFQPNMF